MQEKSLVRVLIREREMEQRWTTMHVQLIPAWRLAHQICQFGVIWNRNRLTFPCRLDRLAIVLFIYSRSKIAHKCLFCCHFSWLFTGCFVALSCARLDDEAPKSNVGVLYNFSVVVSRIYLLKLYNVFSSAEMIGTCLKVMVNSGDGRSDRNFQTAPRRLRTYCSREREATSTSLFAAIFHDFSRENWENFCTWVALVRLELLAFCRLLETFRNAKV